MPVSLQKLVILHTNDIHSHFEQMPRIASLIRARRAAHAEDAAGGKRRCKMHLSGFSDTPYPLRKSSGDSRFL